MDLKTKIRALLTLDDPGLQATSEQKQRAFTALIDTLYRQATVCITATVINASILIYISYDVVSSGPLFFWAALMAGGVIFRILAALRYKNRRGHDSPLRLYRLMLASIIFIGFAWGMAVVCLIPKAGPSDHALFVVIVLCGMAAGALGGLAVPLSAYLGFSLPTLLAVVIRFAFLNHPLHLSLIHI